MTHRTYKPRTASARCNSDCPEGVLAIFDDPRTWERYIIFYTNIENGCISYVRMSDAPGLQRGEMQAYEVAQYRYHNSHRACPWSELPESCKKLVHNDLSAAD